MSVAFITNDWHDPIRRIPNGCNYYRCWLPMSVTNAHIGPPSWDPIRGFGIKETATSGIHGYKTVVLKLLMDRWTSRQVELARSLGQRVIVDVDDFYQGLTPANRAWTTSSPDVNKVTNRDHYERVIERADTITVSTPYLHDYYSSRHDDVRLVRNGVNLRQFQPRTQQRKPVIGWVGSTAYRNNDLEQLREWLPEFLAEHDLMFHHAGHSDDAPPIEEVTGVDPYRVTRTPLTPITHYASGLLFDIGLVPLNPIPFNEAKSNIKGLEYAAAGIPFIASDLPEYRLLHESGIGSLARTPDDWVRAATALLERPVRVREAKRQYGPLRDWTIEARAADWQAALTA